MNRIVWYIPFLISMFCMPSETFEILSLQDALADLPDSPSEYITRSTSSIIVTDGITPITVTVAVPDTICGGQPFTITATITNPNATPTGYDVISFDGLIPTNANVTFASASTPTAGSFNSLAGTSGGCPTSGAPGVGAWTLGIPVPATTTWTLTITCNAGAVAGNTPITNSGQIITTIPSTNCVTTNFTIVQSPVANNYSGSVCSNSVLDGTLTETGGTAPFTFTITTFPPPSQGAIAITNPSTGAFQFTPNSSFSGVASFQFDVRDNNGCTSNIATGNITVYPSPSAAPQSLTNCTNTNINGSVASSSSGGTPPYTYAVVGTPIGGTVSMNAANGNYTFTITHDYIGTGSFMYSVTDANGCTSTNTVSIVFAPDVANPFVTLYQEIYGGVPCN